MWSHREDSLSRETMRQFYLFSFHHGNRLMSANVTGMKLGVREVSSRMVPLVGPLAFLS